MSEIKGFLLWEASPDSFRPHAHASYFVLNMLPNHSHYLVVPAMPLFYICLSFRLQPLEGGLALFTSLTPAAAQRLAESKISIGTW